MTMSRIFGIVDVQDDRNRRSPIRLDEGVHQDVGDAIKIYPRDGVLQPRERRRAGQRRIVGKSLAGHLQGRVLAQRLGVIGVLVAASDLEDPLFEHVAQRLRGVAGVAAIMKDLSDTVKKPHPAFNLAEEKHSAIGGDLTAVKIDLKPFFPGGLQRGTVRWYD